jgi:hypothetical protein
MFNGTFLDFLKAHPDVCFDVDDFLRQGSKASPKKLAELVTKEGFFTEWPQNLVFKESSSKLSGPRGAPVRWFPEQSQSCLKSA